MNEIKETKFDRFIFEAGKIFISIIIILTPVLYTQGLSTDFHIAYKIAFCFLFILDYTFVLFIIDRACSKNYNYIVKQNKNRDVKEEKEEIQEISEYQKKILKDSVNTFKKVENHQMTINEFLNDNIPEKSCATCLYCRDGVCKDEACVGCFDDPNHSNYIRRI